MKRLKFWVTIQLLAVFASGALVGALGYRFYDQRQEAQEVKTKPAKGGPAGFRQHYIQTMRDRLKLSEQQVAQLSAIMDASGKRFNEARQRADAEIRKLMDPEMEALQKEQRTQIEAMLDAEQRAEYAKMLEERRIEMEKRRRDKQNNRPGMPPPPRERR